MIVSFSVANFRSFSSEETFSLVASNRLNGSHENHAIEIPDTNEKVLKSGVIYGANGAGKSNLFKALHYLKSIALKSRKKNSGTGRDVFRLNAEKDKTSDFDIQFIAENKLYRYGFKLDDQRIVEEWLLVGKKEKILYERITDDNGNVTVEAEGLKNSGKKLKALVTVGSPQNQTFLATIQATLETVDVGNELNNVITWFDDSLTLIGPDTPFSSLGNLLEKDDEFAEFSSYFLKSSATGIDKLDVQKQEMTEDELHKLLPKTIVSTLLEKFNDEQSDFAVIQLEEGNELLFERTDTNHYFSITIQAKHESSDGNSMELDLSDESDGTQRLLNLLPALHRLKQGNAVFFIDEIDRSMHPILSKRFLEYFLNSCNGGQHQIIVTTHESNILDLELLRRDEIWFAEKDKTGSTRLYSLSDFKVRNDLDIRKNYLQGRFGAIPFLGNLEKLQLKKDEIT